MEFVGVYACAATIAAIIIVNANEIRFTVFSLASKYVPQGQKVAEMFPKFPLYRLKL
jgi:hypothetical protein